MGIGAAAWWALSGIIAALIGGWVAARLAGNPSRRGGPAARVRHLGHHDAAGAVLPGQHGRCHRRWRLQCRRPGALRRRQCCWQCGLVGGRPGRQSARGHSGRGQRRRQAERSASRRTAAGGGHAPGPDRRGRCRRARPPGRRSTSWCARACRRRRRSAGRRAGSSSTTQRSSRPPSSRLALPPMPPPTVFPPRRFYGFIALLLGAIAGALGGRAGTPPLLAAVTNVRRGGTERE